MSSAKVEVKVAEGVVTDADKGLNSQSYGFSSSPVQMLQFDHQEG